MFHKNVLNAVTSAATSVRSASKPASPEQEQTSSPRLILLPSRAEGIPTRQKSGSPFFDLLAISAHRCSAFFAEAAVLVLVLALLDRFMLKGRMEMGWVISAFTISLTLLGASIATEFSARRWLQRH